MKTIIHRADTRGFAEYGWLTTHYTFSFANYYNPERVHFGALRVLNDDVIQPAMGFGTHPHDNMEIVTIPLSGTIAHKDSMGNVSTITTGEIQVMCAGTGITHSEFNYSKDELVSLLQIWVFPEKKNLTPSYQQKQFDLEGFNNQFQLLVSPDNETESLKINQQAWFSLGEFDAYKQLEYKFRNENSGLYVFVIEGSIKIAETKLEARDGIGISDVPKVEISTLSHSKILVMELPVE